MTHNRIRTAVNDVLSGASARPTLRYRVLSDIRGEQKVKKKLTLGVAQALLLLVLTMTTVTAATLSDPDSRPGDPTTLEQPTGTAFAVDPLSWWEESDIRLMACHFLQAQGLKQQVVFANLTDEEQTLKAREIVRDHYANPETGGLWARFSSYRLMALHCAMQVYHGCYDPDVLDGEFYLLPEEGDMPESEACPEALALLYDRFALPLHFPEEYEFEFAFVVEKGASEPVWRFRYVNDAGCYEAVLSRTGERLRWTTPYTDVICTVPEMLALPDDVPMGGDQAIIDTARMSLSEIGHYDRDGHEVFLDPAHIDAAQARAARIQRSDILGGEEPVWIVEFFYNDSILARVMLDAQGNYMGTAFGTMDFSDTRR